MIPPIARRFVAGESAATALEQARVMNAEGVNVIPNRLGEQYDDRSASAADTEAYVQLIEDISASPLSACISVKPSQLGLDIGAELFRDNLREIVAAADANDVFVWCDMEDHTTTEATLSTVEQIAAEYPWTVGQCLQSNLRRTADDLERLVDRPLEIRLVKGAYDEPGSVAYTEQAKVDDRYTADMRYLFANRERGVAVGTHDPEMIRVAVDYHEAYGTDFELQMLMGVREDRQRELAAEGYEVWQYAPYGDRWLPYFWRRVKERKENALFALRAVVGR
jgi:proline dehydrogenase